MCGCTALLISVNFVVRPLTAENGPMRLVPGLWNTVPPQPEPGDMKRSRLYPVPACAGLLRRGPWRRRWRSSVARVR